MVVHPSNPPLVSAPVSARPLQRVRRWRLRAMNGFRRANPRFEPDISLPIGHAKLYLACSVRMGEGAGTGVGEGVR